MTNQMQGMGLAAAADDTPTAASRTREGSTATLRLRAERLEVHRHQGAYVWFCYEPHPHARFVHQGRIEHVARPIPPYGVDQDEMPTLLRIERVWYALPAGTSVTVEIGELR